MTDMTLFQALGAERGIVCAVGAGGKKTTLYALLVHHPGRAALTSTVFTYEPPRRLAATVVVDRESALRERIPAVAPGPILYAQPADKAGRLAGVSADALATIHRDGRFDLTLVKADGARMRRIKAPAAHEPDIPPQADTVLLLGAASALGEAVTERLAHRLDRVLHVTGLAPGDSLTGSAFARLYTHPEGLLRGTEGKRVIPVINQVDSPGLAAQAQEVARQILADRERFDRVVLLSHGALVDVIERAV